jgi:hypothetical protein
MSIIPLAGDTFPPTLSVAILSQTYNDVPLKKQHMTHQGKIENKYKEKRTKYK